MKTFNGQPQIILPTAKSFKVHMITSRVDVGEMLHENLVLITRSNCQQTDSMVCSSNTREFENSFWPTIISKSSLFPDADIIKLKEGF